MARNIFQRLVFVAVLLAPLPLLTNFLLPLPRAEPSKPGRSLLLDHERHFLEKQYETAAREISLRIEQEHLLFALKFTVLGAVLAFVFRFYSTRENADASGNFASWIIRAPGVAVSSWAAVAVAAILDVRMQYNVNIIIQLGRWIRRLEADLTPSEIPGWEQYLIRSDLWSSTVSPLLLLDRQLITWVLFVITVNVFVPRYGEKGDGALLQVARWALPLCFILFGFVGLQYYYGHAAVLAYCLVVIVIAAVSWAWVQSLKRFPMQH